MLPSVSSVRVQVRGYRLKRKQFKTWNNTVKVAFLHSCQLRVLVSESDKVPKSCHFYELRVKFLIQLLQQHLKMVGYVFDCAAMKQDKVKNLGPLIHVLLPLCLSVHQ